MAEITKSRGRKPLASGLFGMSYNGEGRYSVTIWDIESSKLFVLSMSREEADRLRNWLNKPKTF